LERILAFVDELKEADAPSQEEVLVGEVRNVLRDDVELHKGGEYTEKILKNAPSREGDYIKVKNIL
jgi:Asp-tRNA(Asn)/Glu-tRNA(Gln) amidotransferase C subunit